MKYLLFLFSIISLPLFGQSVDTMRTGPLFTIVQHVPRFKGNLNDYLSANIKYPEAEKKKGITGTVYINFVVNKDGSISDAKVLRGVQNGPGLDAEALRVVSSMPAWIPGENGGKVVRVQYNLPIHFELN